MSFQTVEREVQVCDGCGYIFGKGDVIVELKWQEDLFHFHDSQDHGFDCFTYWLDKGRALIATDHKGDRALTPEELKLANAVGALIPPIGKKPIRGTDKALAIG